METDTPVSRDVRSSPTSIRPSTSSEALAGPKKRPSVRRTISDERPKKKSRGNGYSMQDSAPTSDADGSDAAEGTTLDAMYGFDSAEFNLETFQKEAIHRQMLEYKRQYDRVSAHSTQLQTQLVSLRSSSGAIEAAWLALLKSLRSALAADASQTNVTAEGETQDFPEIQQVNHLQAYSEALSQTSNTTNELINALLTSAPADTQALKNECTQLALETYAHKKALALLHIQLDQVQTQLEQTHHALLLAEKKVDRSKSVSVAKVEGRSLTNGIVKHDEDQIEQQVKDEDPSLLISVPEISSEPDKKPSNTEDHDYIAHIAKKRLEEIDNLRSERIRLIWEIDDLKVKLSSIPSEVVAESEAYKSLKLERDGLELDADSALLEAESLQKELDEMREAQTTWHDSVLKEATAQADELKARVAARDTDLNRIRLQREELRAENNECKAREAEKLRQIDQIRTLSNSKEDRLTAFKSEVKRLRMKIAADRGDSDAVSLEAVADDESRIVALTGQLKSATDLTFALRDQLKSYSTNSGKADSQTLIKSETQARQELAKAKEELAQLQSSLDQKGTTISGAELLRQREDHIRVLEASAKAQDMASNMLINEVERLSAAWQLLDEQNRDKVLNLVLYEEKLTKLVTEKSKADNKYFAAMRAKEALLGENQVLTKAAERQTKAIESLNETKAALLEQLTATEKETTLCQQSSVSLNKQLHSVTLERDHLSLKLESEAKRSAEAQSLLRDRSSQAETSAAAKVRLEEQVERLEQQVQSQKAALEAQATASAKDTSNAKVQELEKFNADLSKMLKCTSCQLRFKTHVITRCYHLLCHECIEARLTNRQRKCPTCSMPFGQADVSQVYF